MNLAEWAQSLATADIVVRGRRVKVRLLSAAEAGRARAAGALIAPEPAAPVTKAGRPDEHDPAYQRALRAHLMAVRACEAVLACAERGEAALDLEAGGRAALAALAEEELLTIARASQSLGLPASVVSVQALLDQVDELARACDLEQKPGLVGLCRDLRLNLERLGVEPPAPRTVPEVRHGSEAAIKK